MQSNYITKRLTAGLLSLVMLLTLLPTAVFAEEVTEDAPLCVCETACTAESLHADCPVCGAEGAVGTDCGLYTAPDPEPTDPEPTVDPEPTADPEPTTDPEPTAEPETPEAPAVPVPSAEPREPTEYVPTEPQDAKTVQAMIDALPDADDAADMTEEELEAAYVQAAEAYTAFELLNAEEMQSITGVEKILALLDALTAAAAVLAEETSTQSDQYFTYKNNSDGTGFIITGLTNEGKAATELTIPDTFTGDVTVTYKDDEDKEVTETIPGEILPVVEVGGAAFRNADKLEKLTLGKNIRVIGNNAFAAYKVNDTFVSELEEVVIPADSALEEIGHNAFQNNRKLTRIGIVGADGTATLPASLTYIGSYAFYDCTGLTQIYFDASEDAALKTIGDSTFACSGLTSVTMPDSVRVLGHNAFAACPNLTRITVSENLNFMGIWGFANNAKLESVTFKGRYPLKKFGLGGFENYLTFEGVNKDCIVYVPQPNDEEYANVLDSVYSPGRGAAVPTVRLLWWDNEDAAPKEVPGTPGVTEASLNTLNTTEFKRSGITIKKGAEGCAAVITVKEGSGLVAPLEAALPEGSEGSVYWVTVEAFVNRTAGIKATGGEALTNGMYDFVYRRSGGGGGSSINLDTTGKRGRTVFYFPIATNYGSKDAPERSAVGQPVKVMYVADEPQPSIVGTGNKWVYVGNGQFGNARTSRPVQDEVFIDDENGARKKIDAFSAFAPRKVYTAEDADPAATTNNHEMRAEVMVPGFEALIPDNYKDENGELIENETQATNHKPEREEASIRYQWYIAYEKGTAIDKYTPLNCQGANDTAVYGGMGSDGLLWRIGRPSNLGLSQVLKPGMNFLYAKVTVTMNEKTTTLNTGITEFYCFDDDFRVTLTSDNWGSIKESRDNKTNKLLSLTEEGVLKNAERVLTVALDEGEVADPDNNGKAYTMMKDEKTARYREMFDACYEKTKGTIKFYNGRGTGASAPEITEIQKSFETTGRSFAMPTERLGDALQYDTSVATVLQISLGSGGTGAEVHFQFGDDPKNGLSFYTPVYFCQYTENGTTVGDANILLNSAYWWGETEGTPESPDWNMDYFKIYFSNAQRAADWNAGKYVAELYQVDSADQTRGGTRVMTLNGTDALFETNKSGDVTDDFGEYTANGEADDNGNYYANCYRWTDPPFGSKPGLNLYYWRVYEKANTSCADYSPVFARFQSEGKESGASVTITAGQTAATFSGDTLELPFVLRSVDLSAYKLFSTTMLKLQYWNDADNVWTEIKDNENAWVRDTDDAKANSSAIMSGGSLFTTAPYTVALNRTFIKDNASAESDFFEEYGYGTDNGTVKLRLAWVGKNAYVGTEVYSAEIEVTKPKNAYTPTVYLRTTATLDSVAQGNDITRNVEYEKDDEGNDKKDENGKKIVAKGEPVILTAKAYCMGNTEPTSMNARWVVQHDGKAVATLSALNQTETIGNATFTVTGYTDAQRTMFNRKIAYVRTMTVSVSSPTSASLYAYTLIPEADATVERGVQVFNPTTGSMVTRPLPFTGTATAPFYTLTHNPAAYAAYPRICHDPNSVNVRPSANTENVTLTAEAYPLTDGGALSWQWYLTSNANSTKDGSAVKDANGSGTVATLTLPASQLKNVGMYYYYCKFTNTNPSVTSNSKTSSSNTAIARVNVSEGLVELKKPIISEGITDFTFQWANLDQLSDYARWLVVKQPAALKGAEPTWVNFPTPRQSEVELKLYVEKKQVNGEWKQVGESVRSESITRGENGKIYGSYLECAEIGDYYYYSSTDIDSYLRMSYTHLGIAKEEPVRFRLEWTVTNKLDRSSDSDFPTPTNLTGAMETTATSTVYIVREPMEVPTFRKYELKYDDEDGGGSLTNQVDFYFEEGVPVEWQTDSVTLDGKTYTGFPVFQIAQGNNGTNYDRKLSFLPQLETKLGQVNARLEVFDTGYSTPWRYSSHMNDCSTTLPSEFAIYWNHKPSSDSTISYFRIRLENEENNITSAYAYSGIFGVKWVEPTDAATPQPPASFDSASRTWYYQLNEGSPETISLELGSVDPWTADGNVPTYAWSYSYTDKDGDYHKETIAGATGTSLTLVKDTPPMNELIAAMKEKTENKYVYFYITATNYDPTVTGNRTATNSETITVYFKPRLSLPEVSIVTPEITTVSTGETIPLSLNFPNKAQIEAEGGSLSYYWYYQFVSVTGATGLDTTLKKNCSDYTKESAYLETMTVPALSYRFLSDKDTYQYEYLGSNWWAAHPDAEVKLKIFCEVKNEKDYDSDGGFYYDPEKVTTAPLEITITRPTFNRGLTVTTYDADGTLKNAYTDPDPTTDIVVPANGKAVFTMPEGEIRGTPTWYQQLEDAEYPGLVSSVDGDTDWQRTITYAQMLENGVFTPRNVWAQVSSNINSNWKMDTVKVRLVPSGAFAPEITLTGKEYLNTGDSTNFTAKVTNIADLKGEVTCKWFMRAKETDEWTDVSTSGVTDKTAGSYGLVLEMKDTEPGTTVYFKVAVTHTRDGETVTVERTATVTTRKLTINLPETMPPAYQDTAYEAFLTLDWIGEKGVNFEWTAPTGYYVEALAAGSGYKLWSNPPTALTNADLTVTAKLSGTELCSATEKLNIAVNPKPTGVTVSGKVKSYDPKNATTITLKQGDAVKYTAAIAALTEGSGQHEQTFKIEGVAAGTYDLVVTKACHLTYTITDVTVGTENLDLTTHSSDKISTITLLAGDVDGDGYVSESDVSVIRYAANINQTQTSAANPLADVDGDGYVGESDVSVVRYANHINKRNTDCEYDFKED